jgi:hypothetical protein
VAISTDALLAVPRWTPPVDTVKPTRTCVPSSPMLVTLPTTTPPIITRSPVCRPSARGRAAL